MIVGLGFLKAYYIFAYLWFIGGFLAIAIVGIKNAIQMISKRNNE